MDRRLFGRAGLGMFAATAIAAEAGSAKAAGKAHRVAIQVSSEDRHTQGLALGNAHNYVDFYKAKGEPATVEIVVFGPGYSMVRADLSMLKGEVEDIQKALGSSLTISACQNTRRAIADSMGKSPDAIPLLPGIRETPSGIVRLAELRDDGWPYIRP